MRTGMDARQRNMKIAVPQPQRDHAAISAWKGTIKEDKMKRLCLLLVFILTSAQVPFAQGPATFDQYFIDQTLRVDYDHFGSAAEETAALDRVLIQGIWAGSKNRLIDPFDNGRFCVKVYDLASGTLIFSRGFDAYFGEYQTTDDALKGIKKVYHESALIPCPKNKIKFALESRDRQNALHPIFSCEIDPRSITILRKPLSAGVKVFDLLKNGDPHQRTDVAFIAEGYTAQEESKLRSDLDRVVRAFFSQEPFKSMKDKFNITGVWKPSDESGCDEPGYGRYKNTAVNATFDSLGSDRYVLTEDNESLRDIAAHVPYDALAVMINHDRYGGGGIYHMYCTFTVDGPWSEYLLLHEFGHSFAGLADEYYTSDVAYNEFYPKGVEPLEANITALLDPKNLKWKSLATPGIEVPTPWEKDEFDKKDLAYQKARREMNEKIAKMKRSGAPPADVAKAEDEAERMSREQSQWVDRFLAQSRYAGKVGAFEGAGYAAIGFFRPAADCLMFTKGLKPYCKVCEAAVRRRIEFCAE